MGRQRNQDCGTACSDGKAEACLLFCLPGDEGGFVPLGDSSRNGSDYQIQNGKRPRNV